MIQGQWNDRSESATEYRNHPPSRFVQKDDGSPSRCYEIFCAAPHKTPK